MSGLRAYLLSVVSCAFLVSLASLIPVQKPVKKAMQLCCGCLLVITAVRPLARLDLNAMTPLLDQTLFDEARVAREAETEHEKLLQGLIREQTCDYLEKRADAMGISAAFEVGLEPDPSSGTWLPWTVEIRGTISSEQRQALSEWIEKDLNIPAERQRWLLP